LRQPSSWRRNLIKSETEDSLRGERRFVVFICHNSTELPSITHASLQKEHEQPDMQDTIADRI
jgi:hypothetical protein